MGFVLTALVLWGPPAAETPRWDVPATCPAQAEVDAWVDRLMLDGAGDVPDWQGRVDALEDGGFELTLTVPGQTRVVADEDCGRLAVAAALVIAVAADPVAVAGTIDALPTRAPIEPAPAPAVVLGPPRSMESKEPAPVVGRFPAPRDPPVRLFGMVSGAIGAELAVLPRPGFAVSLAGGLRRSSLRFDLVGLVSVPRDVEAPAAGFGARAAVAAGQLRACRIVDAKPVEFPLCLAGEVGGVWARGFGPTIEPRPRTQPWAAAVPSLGVTGWISKRLGLEARISVPVALYQPAVHLEGVEVDVFRAGSVGARAWVGPVLRFP